MMKMCLCSENELCSHKLTKTLTGDTTDHITVTVRHYEGDIMSVDCANVAGCTTLSWSPADVQDLLNNVKVCQHSAARCVATSLLRQYVIYSQQKHTNQFIL